MSMTIKDAVEKFINDLKDIENNFTDASVCMLLLKLTKRYKLNETDKIYPNIFEPLLIKYRKKLEIEEKECLELIEFMHKKLTEGTNKINIGTYYQDSAPKVLSLSLKQVSDLVCTVMFSADDLDEMAIQDKVKALYLYWKDLHKAAAKNQPYRHQDVCRTLVLTLCGFDPLADDTIIEHFESFLEKKAAEYLVKIFKQKNSAQQIKYILDVVNKNTVAKLDSQSNLELGLKQYLAVACAERGVNATDKLTQDVINFVVNNILNKKDFFETIPEIKLYIHYLHKLRELLLSNDKGNLVIAKARQIFKECTTLSDLKNKGLFALLEMNETIEYLKESLFIISCYKKIPEAIELDKIINEKLYQITKDCNAFVVNSDTETEHLLIVEQKQIFNLKTRIEKFKNTTINSDINNFFALFNSTPYISEKSKIAQAIAAKKQFIIFDNDKILMQEFNKDRNNESTFLSPYQINRILLHAILSPIDKPWSEYFSHCFDSVLDFLQKLATDSVNEGSLKSSSYPTKLLDVLKALSPKLGGTKNIKDIRDLSRLLQLLPEYNQAVLVQQLGIEYIKNIVVDADGLSRLLAPLSEQNQIITMAQLDTEYVKKIVVDIKSLCSLFGCLLGQNWMMLVNNLDKEYIKELSKNAQGLCALLKHLPEQERSMFICQLGEGSAMYLKNIAKKETDVIDILKQISKSDRLKFITLRGGLECVKDLFGDNKERLQSLLNLLSEEEQLEFQRQFLVYLNQQDRQDELGELERSNSSRSGQ